MQHNPLEAVEEKEIPSLPAKIDVKHLNKDGKLISETELKKIEKLFEKKNTRRIKYPLSDSKDKQFRKAAVIELTNASNEKNYFAIYQGEKHGKHLGKGGYGKVKLAQNIKTGEWIALKISNYNSNTAKRGAEREAAILERSGASPGYFVREETNKEGITRQQVIIGMSLASGEDIGNIFFEKDENKEYKRDTATNNFVLKKGVNADKTHLMEISLGMAHAVSDLHQTGLIHRDIKPEQFIYDPMTKNVKLIDLGSAVEANEPMASSKKGVTPQYLSAEIIEESSRFFTEKDAAKKYLTADGKINKAALQAVLDKDPKKNNYGINSLVINTLMDADPLKKNHYDLLIKIETKSRGENVTFSPASDVYALGISLGQLYGLTKVVDFETQFKLNKDDYLSLQDYSAVFQIKDKSEISDASLHDMADLLKKMTAPDPKDRLGMDEVVRSLEQMQKKLPGIKISQPDVLLDVKHYLRQEKTGREKIMTQLTQLNANVVLVSDQSIATRDLLAAKRELEQKNIAVHTKSGKVPSLSITAADLDTIKKKIKLDPNAMFITTEAKRSLTSTLSTSIRKSPATKSDPSPKIKKMEKVEKSSLSRSDPLKRQTSSTMRIFHKVKKTPEPAQNINKEPAPLDPKYMKETRDCKTAIHSLSNLVDQYNKTYLTVDDVAEETERMNQDYKDYISQPNNVEKYQEIKYGMQIEQHRLEDFAREISEDLTAIEKNWGQYVQENQGLRAEFDDMNHHLQNGEGAKIRSSLENFDEDLTSHQSMIKFSQAALLEAVQKQDTVKVNELLSSGVDANSTKNKVPALETAVMKGNKDIVQLLLEHGADPNARNKQQETVLFNAVKSGNQELVSLLYKHGANINIVNQLKETPLSCANTDTLYKQLLIWDEQERKLVEAVKTGDVQIAEQLLSAGINVNATERDVKRIHSPLLALAVEKENTKMVDLLLNYGANPKLKNGYGESALVMAKDKPDQHIYQQLKSAVEKKITSGKPAQKPREETPTVVHSALRH